MKHGLLTPCSLVVLWTLVLCLRTLSCEARRSDKAYRSGDYAKAAKELEYIAEEGDARAQYDLGLLYDTGRGVPQSNEKALQWYRKAAEQGNAVGQNNLADMYVGGRGVARRAAPSPRRRW